MQSRRESPSPVQSPLTVRPLVSGRLPGARHVTGAERTGRDGGAAADRLATRIPLPVSRGGFRRSGPPQWQAALLRRPPALEGLTPWSEDPGGHDLRGDLPPARGPARPQPWACLRPSSITAAPSLVLSPWPPFPETVNSERRFLPPGLTPVTPSPRLGKAYPALLASLESGLPCPTGGVVLKVLVEDPGTPDRGWELCRHRSPPGSTDTRPEALCIHRLPCRGPAVLGGTAS